MIIYIVYMHAIPVLFVALIFVSLPLCLRFYKVDIEKWKKKAQRREWEEHAYTINWEHEEEHRVFVFSLNESMERILICTRVVIKILFGLSNAEINICKILSKISQVQITGIQIDFNDHFVAQFMNPFYGRFDLKY